MLTPPGRPAGSRCQFRLTTANASPAGAKVSPARIGESPRPPCRCSASTKKNPPNTAITQNRAAIPAAVPGSRSSRPGISGAPPRAAARRAPAIRQGPEPGQEQQHPDRDVQQEHRAPGAAEQVRADQHAADDLAGDRAAGQHGRVQPHRAAPCGTGERPLDEAEDLRDHRRRPGTLDEAQRHQHAGRGGQAAAERGEGEHRQAGQEHAPVAQDVAEPGTGDQEHRVGDHVAGDNKLQPGSRGVQAGMDRGRRDVDDGRVQNGHELPGEDHRERRPEAPGGPLGGAGRPGNGEGVCHGYQPAGPPMPVPRACLSWYQHYLATTPPPRQDGVMAVMTTANGQHRRAELAAFLRTRRERTTPEQAGLPPGSRRRTPGLRREEVAQLSGVGVTWYTWLEQGRQINASPQVLSAVARTLLLDQAEREHLFRLADLPDAATAAGAATSGCEQVLPEVQEILDALAPMPASVVNERFDLLAWNASYQVLWPGVTGADPGERNILWQCFTYPDCCHPYVNRHEQLAMLVAQLRGAYG